MKNTNSKEYKATVREYLTPIVIDKLEACSLPTEGNIFKTVIDCARSEVGHEFARHGEQGGLKEWLQGLGMGIDYMNYRILELAAEWHGCAIPEHKKDAIIDGWWMHIAHKMIQFARETK